MRFYLAVINLSGYSVRKAFDADNLEEAAQRHIAAFKELRASSAIVMRGQDGKRYSVADSVRRTVK